MGFPFESNAVVVSFNSGLSILPKACVANVRGVSLFVKMSAHWLVRQFLNRISSADMRNDAINKTKIKPNKIFNILFLRFLKNRLNSFKNWLKFSITVFTKLINLFLRPKSKVLNIKKIFSEQNFKKKLPLKVFKNPNSETKINLDFFSIFVDTKNPNKINNKTLNFSEKELTIL